MKLYVKSWRKILVIKLRAMGDTVLTTATLSQIKHALPQVRVHCLAPEAWADLLEQHPHCDKIWRWQKSASWRERMTQVMQIRDELYDAVIALHASGTSAWLAVLAGVDHRTVHFHGIHDLNRFSTVEIPGKGIIKPILERDFDPLRAFGIEPRPSITTSVFLSEAEVKTAQAEIRQRGLKAPLLALGLGASRPSKVWPLERFVSIAEKWRRETGGDHLVMLGPQEAGAAQFFAANKVLLGGALRANAALLSQCVVFIGNDSGPKHLAAALAVPTVTVFGPENPLEWHPYNRTEHPALFVEKLPCRKALAPGLPEWCGVFHCTEYKHRCMQEISEDQVWAEVMKIWRQPA